MIDAAIAELAPVVGVRRACQALGETQARWYRRHRQGPPVSRPARLPGPQPRALSVEERDRVRQVLNSPEHVDEAPATVYAKLLDEGIYLASVPTMYRILRSHGEVRERRRQATHPAHKKPELIATGPNQCWSWDITKLLGPAKWTYYYLIVTWNHTVGLNGSPFHELRGRLRLVDWSGGEVAGFRSSRASCRVAGDLDRPRSGAADDRRVCARAC